MDPRNGISWREYSANGGHLKYESMSKMAGIGFVSDSLAIRKVQGYCIMTQQT